MLKSLRALVREKRRPAPWGAEMKLIAILLADDDVAARAHRAGDHRPVVLPRLDRALARDPDVAAEMVFLLREVVMRVDPLELELGLVPSRRRRPADLGQHAVHHLVAVVKRELLRPVQVAHVRRECGVVFGQIGQVAVG